MKYIILLLTVLFSLQSYAADDGDWWLQRQIEIAENNNNYSKKVYGKSARMIQEEVPIPNSTKTEVRDLIKRSIAVDTPTATKVGTPMLKRITHLAKTPGIQMVGVLAVTELIEAIGWVMKDGSYVKLKPISETPGPYLYIAEHSPDWTQVTYSASAACSAFVSHMKSAHDIKLNYVGIRVISGTEYCDYGGTSISINYQKTKNPNYDPQNPPEPDYEEIPLTPAVLGAMMLGTGYNDPVDPDKYNPIANTGGSTGVKEVYEHDSTGVGNEVAEDMDDKLRNAPDTDGGTSSYVGDPVYDSADLPADSDAADRSWTEDGGTATGGTEQEVDSGGNPTGNTSISLQFPLFCSWASKMCQWYDDWKASDKVYKDYMTKTEEHQTEEKSFWEDVKDWFDWTKEPVDEEPETEEEEPDTQGIFDRTFDTAFSLSKECPPDIPFSLETEFFSGSWNISMNWLCIIFTFLGYPLVFLSHCVGLWILYEAVVQREIKW